jgi:hypothetical protein
MKRGPKPKSKVKIKWSAGLAYAIGLLATDGSLSKDGRHIDFTSADLEQIENYLKALNVWVKIGIKFSSKNKISYRVQFSDIPFYRFLQSIGLTPKKSLTIGKIKIPDHLFFDFLRGCFDGDGTFYSYWDPRWKSSHMFYIEFISASKAHIDWLRMELKKRNGILGYINKGNKKSIIQLKYAKKEAIEIIKKIYYNRQVVCLSRKRKKIEKALNIEKKQQDKYTVN